MLLRWLANDTLEKKILSITTPFMRFIECSKSIHNFIFMNPFFLVMESNQPINQLI
jgi:hypothetical protein